MSRLETHDTAWGNLANVFQSDEVAEPKSGQPGQNPVEERQRWQTALDDWLLEWARDPSLLEDEGTVVPSADIIQLACRVAGDLRDAGVPGPQRVAATGDGGIVFVRQAGPVLSTLEVDTDGSIELVVFHDGRLVSRQRLL